MSDGVSTSPCAAQAAAIAARCAADHLADALQTGQESCDALPGLMRAAFGCAGDAVLAAAGTDGVGSWACTLVVAALWRGRIVVGNLGDSRCYWFGHDGVSRLLSTDDSLAQTRIELGVTRRIAESGAQAHAILKWLGPGSGRCEPSLQTLDPAAGGWLVVCSDGLWNYASPPDEMHEIVAACLAEHALPAWRLAEQLTIWANRRGGHDNISVGIIEVPDPGAER